MVRHKLWEKAHGIVIVSIGKIISFILLARIFPIACCALEVHDREQHMDHNGFGNGWLVWVIFVINPQNLRYQHKKARGSEDALTIRTKVGLCRNGVYGCTIRMYHRKYVTPSSGGGNSTF